MCDDIRTTLPVYEVPELGKDMSHTTRRPVMDGSGSAVKAEDETSPGRCGDTAAE
eukprot:CAMPEP_0183301294 /NCGR_PEP_ID=MMETSP0160_2-20130417/7459_1 /TAXON_ID=2839 ORGANISM="Odontella Sinensis, Strain Grunow 1884" /NCGR_SAMPLE_ID=MMETSP0160_2 /ASSEMBLY_ACC=CAM_ASM_000250 /LENGTH=54 /DNA_ID=CAMNT_0025463887 /DNA_START=1279 /DNA_END=1443 /DNA_ORIENTATION=+